MNTSVTKVQPGMEAIEKLEDFIKVNRLKPHTRIPCDKDLCDLWGVSRSTLRQAVDELSGKGIPISVISTLNSENVGSLEALRDILIHKDIFAWQLQACSPMGNATKSGIDYKFDFAEVIRFVKENAGRYPFAIGIADNIG